MVEHEKVLILTKEYDLLHQSRGAELSKSLVTLKLLECKGVKKDKIDSLMVVMHHANETLAKRDSVMMAKRKVQLDNWFK